MSVPFLLLATLPCYPSLLNHTHPLSHLPPHRRISPLLARLDTAISFAAIPFPVFLALPLSEARYLSLAILYYPFRKPPNLVCSLLCLPPLLRSTCSLVSSFQLLPFRFALHQSFNTSLMNSQQLYVSRSAQSNSCIPHTCLLYRSLSVSVSLQPQSRCYILAIPFPLSPPRSNCSLLLSIPVPCIPFLTLPCPPHQHLHSCSAHVSKPPNHTIQRPLSLMAFFKEPINNCEVSRQSPYVASSFTPTLIFEYIK